MQTESAQSTGAWWRYIAALPLLIGAVLLGNLLGIVVTSVWGLHGMAPEKPGGVVLGAIQAAIGVWLAFAGAERFLGGHRYAAPWVLAFVVLGFALVILGTGAALFLGRLDYLDWEFASGVAGLVAAEVVRRVVKSDGLG